MVLYDEWPLQMALDRAVWYNVYAVIAGSGLAIVYVESVLIPRICIGYNVRPSMTGLGRTVLSNEWQTTVGTRQSRSIRPGVLANTAQPSCLVQYVPHDCRIRLSRCLLRVCIIPGFGLTVG